MTSAIVFIHQRIHILAVYLTRYIYTYQYGNESQSPERYYNGLIRHVLINAAIGSSKLEFWILLLYYSVVVFSELIVTNSCVYSWNIVWWATVTRSCSKFTTKSRLFTVRLWLDPTKNLRGLPCWSKIDKEGYRIKYMMSYNIENFQQQDFWI